MKPHWERGYRSHGYWLGNTRLGRVSLPPRWRAASHYHWELDATRKVGRVATLREAKRIVERAFDEAGVPQ